MDQSSGDSQISGRFHDVTVNWRVWFPWFWNVWCEGSVYMKRLLDKHVHFRKGVSVEEQTAQKYDRVQRRKQISHMIYEHFEQLSLMMQLLPYQIFSMFPYKEMTFRISIQTGIKLHYNLHVKYQKKCPGEFVQIEDTRFGSASDCIGYLWTRKSMPGYQRLNEDYGKEIHWSDDQDAQLQSAEWKDWDRSVSQESQREESQRWQGNGTMLSVESKLDSVQEETLAVSATGAIVDNKHNRLLLLQRRTHTLTEENPRKVLAPGEKVLLEEKVKTRAKLSSKGIVRIRRMILDIISFVKMTQLYRDASSATFVCSDTLRLMGSPVKSRSGEKGSVASLKQSVQQGCVS